MHQEILFEQDNFSAAHSKLLLFFFYQTLIWFVECQTQESLFT